MDGLFLFSPPCLTIMKPRRKGLGFHITNLWQRLGIGGGEGSGLWHWRPLGFRFGESV